MSEISEKEMLEALSKNFENKDKVLKELEGSYKKLEDAHKKLYESERSKSNFLSNLRNAINNPMASLVALSEEMIHIDLGDKDKYKQMAAMLLSETLNLDSQIRNLLTAAEIESGDVELDIARVEVNSVLSSATSNLKHHITEKKIVVKTNIKEDLWINTDPDKFYSIVFNLLSNGVVFNTDGGLLDISMAVEDDEFTYSVRDGGVGIDKEDQQEIFNRFVQLDSGPTKKYGGLGLGLSVARAATDLLGGEIAVQSTPGRGSVFTLTLPANLNLEASNVCIDGVELFDSDGEEKEL